MLYAKISLCIFPIAAMAIVHGCSSGDHIVRESRSYEHEAEVIAKHVTMLLSGEVALDSNERAIIAAIHGERAEDVDRLIDELKKGITSGRDSPEGYRLTIVAYQCIHEQQVVDRKFQDEVVSSGAAPIDVYLADPKGYLLFVSGIVRDGQVTLVSLYPQLK